MIVGLSGGIAVGKSTMAGALAGSVGGTVVTVREALRDVLGLTAADRSTFQREGAALDASTDGRWLRDYLERMGVDDGPALFIVDAFRTRRQFGAVVERFPSTCLVHLRASDQTRSRRYADAAQADVLKASTTLTHALDHETERGADDLEPLATLVVETDNLSPESIAKLVVRELRL